MSIFFSLSLLMALSNLGAAVQLFPQGQKPATMAGK